MNLDDALLREMLDRRASRASLVGLERAVLATTATAPQRDRRLTRLGLGTTNWGRRLLIVAVTGAILAGGLLALAGAPTERDDADVAQAFVKPFAYVVPAGSDLVLAPGGRWVAAWVVGANRPAGSNDPPWGGQGRLQGNTRGIIVASGEQAWTHGVGAQGARVPLPADPAAFLDVLRDPAIGVGLRPPKTITLDGRPALSGSTADRTTRFGTDIHVASSPSGLAGSDIVMLNLPYRLIVTDVDGFTVFIMIWARSERDLEAFMPTATQFVESIHFLDP